MFETTFKLPPTTFPTKLAKPFANPSPNFLGPCIKPLRGSLKNSTNPVPTLCSKPIGLPSKSEDPRIL